MSRHDSDPGITQVQPLQQTLGRAMTPAASGPAQLVALVGIHAGQVFRVSPTSTIIGRDAKADIRLEGLEISRIHARISRVDDRWIVEDLGSSNGIGVNGVAVDRQEIAFGDRIHLGRNVILMFARYDELEARAQRIHRLDAMAEQAGQVAHDIGSVFAAVLGNLAHIDAEIHAGQLSMDDLAECLADIRQGAESAVKMTRRLMEFSRRAPAPKPSDVSLGAVVDEVVRLLERTAGSDISFATEIDAKLRVHGHRDSLYQVVLNLCANARDAMPNGGSLTVRTHERELDHQTALTMHLHGSGRYVELEVTDTGTGMDDAILARAFEPFYTTKGPGKGTGLGLASVYGIIRNHGGNIFVESSPGLGTRFRVVLPTHRSSPPAAPTLTPSRRRPRPIAERGPRRRRESRG